MNPQNNSELPPVYHGGPEAQQVPTDQLLPAAEQVAETVRAQAVEKGVGAPVQATPPSAAAQTLLSVADPSQSVATAGQPQIADDLDLIEKEWVEKAKAIVEQTKHDPRTQSREINRFKADYLKRRFNKEVKLEEE